MQTNWVLRCACVVAATTVVAQMPTSPARAQQDSAARGYITEADIEQRSKFKQLISPSQAPPSREQVIDELIEEKLKIRQWGKGVSDQQVEGAYAEMAARMGRTAKQVTEDLARREIDVETLKHRIRADIAWQRAMYLRRGRVEQPKLRGPTGDFWWLDDRERNFRR